MTLFGKLLTLFWCSFVQNHTHFFARFLWGAFSTMSWKLWRVPNHESTCLATSGTAIQLPFAFHHKNDASNFTLVRCCRQVTSDVLINSRPSGPLMEAPPQQYGENRNRMRVSIARHRPISWWRLQAWQVADEIVAVERPLLQCKIWVERSYPFLMNHTNWNGLIRLIITATGFEV